MAEISPAGDALASSPRTHEQNARISTSETGKPPLLAFAMLKRAIGDDIFSLDSNQLSARIYAGVLLKDGEGQELPYTRIYRVDKKLNKSCWMILAKGLSIHKGDNFTSWEWEEEEEVSCYPDKVKVPVPELMALCHLEISGKCNTIMLSPWTTYKVEIIVKMTSESSGWNVPVNLTLALPDGNKQERMERLDRLAKEEWVPISIGEFETTPKTVGNISFSLRETGPQWKCGLCVQAIVIRPTT